MRLLKQKIHRATKFKQERLSKYSEISEASTEYQITSSNQRLNKKMNSTKQRRKRIPGVSSTSEQARRTKNIVKNYGKAICGFAGSHLAVPYLEKLAENLKFDIEDFLKHANKKKTTVDSIDTFKLLFMEAETDNDKEIINKQILKSMGEIFIKYFSVNWIFCGKMTYKEAHLKFRFKILRRVMNPELFTYLRPHRAKSDEK